MSRLLPFAFALLCVAGGACGGGEDPNVRTADWQENFERSTQLTVSGDHDAAIAIGEAFLKKHPDNVDGLLMLGAALLGGGRAASDARRPARFEQAVKHFTRALELTKNPHFRVVAISSLVDLYSPQGLNNPEEAMRYARMYIADDPSDISSYGTAVHLLKEAKKYDEAVALLAQAKGAVEPTGEALARYGGMVHDLVALAPGFPRETGRTLLAETVPVIEQALSKHGRTEELLRAKGALLRAQAEFEPDAARQKALLDESNRTYEEHDRLRK